MFLYSYCERNFGKLKNTFPKQARKIRKLEAFDNYGKKIMFGYDSERYFLLPNLCGIVIQRQLQHRASALVR